MKKRLVVFCQLLPVIISLLVLGAHFVRSGNILLMLVSIALIFSLFVREPFMARTMQIVLLGAAAEWIRFAFVLVSARMEDGQPWTRLAIVIGGVVLLAVASIFVFYTKSLKEMYHLAEDENQETSKNQSAGVGGSAVRNTAGAASAELLELHGKKVLLNALSPFALVLMDFFMVGGVFALVGVGFANNSLRRKMNVIGGVLSLQEKKTNFFRQTVLMLGISCAIMLYFYLSMPTPIMQKITMSVVAAYAVFMCIVGSIEYLHKDHAS